MLTGLNTERAAATAKAHAVEDRGGADPVRGAAAWWHNGAGDSAAHIGNGAVLRPACDCADGGDLGPALIGSSAQGEVSPTRPARGHRNGHHAGDVVGRPQGNRRDHRAVRVRVRSPDHAYESTGSRACSARGWYR